MWIETVSRVDTAGESETLEFKPGLNLIVGLPNTGKSTWLAIIDFLLGKGGAAQEAIGPSPAAKYRAASMLLHVGDQLVELTRDWGEGGLRSKIDVNGESVTPAELSDVLMQALRYPLLRFPQGNPFSDRTWPSLTFRILLRHMYREETAWSELAPGQPPSEQHAALAMFLGLAEDLFPVEYGELVEKRKQLAQLTSEKANYERVLSDVAREVVAAPGLSVAITPASLDQAMIEIQAELASAESERQRLVQSQTDEDNEPVVSDLAEETAQLTHILARLADEQRALADRLHEVVEYRTRVDAEKSRLRRAQTAGKTLGRLPVSCCPVCESPVNAERDPDRCQLCGQVSNLAGDYPAADERVQFEIDQLSEESREIEQLEAALKSQLAAVTGELGSARSDLKSVSDRLASLTSHAWMGESVARVAASDIGIGRLQERLDQLNRVGALLQNRDDHGARIDRLESDISVLEGELASSSHGRNLMARSDALADGMNDYLNMLKRERPEAWPEPPARFVMRERDFSFYVANRSWDSVLGATLRLYLLFAYHHGLMSLGQESDTRYPGFAILDLPPSLVEGSDITEYGDYAIRPFLPLMHKKKHQLIISGRDFPTIADAHRVELVHQWRV